MIIRLSNNGEFCVQELCIQSMNLQIEEENSIKKCISRYSKPSSFCECLSWLLFRISNAIKSIWGASDWKKTHQLLHRKIIDITKEKELFQENPQDKLSKKINLKVLNFSDKLSSNILSFCLFANEQKEEFDNQIKAQIEGLKTENWVMRMENIVARIREKR